MHHKYRQTALTLALVAALFGCGQANKPQDPAAAAASAPMDKSYNAESAATAAAPAENSVNITDQVASSAATYTDSERKFIRTANAAFGVKNVYQSALAIEDAVSAQGGFVVENQIASNILNSNRYRTDDDKIMELSEYNVTGNLTVRVPSNNTQAFLIAIANQIEFLEQRSFSAKDAQFDLLRQQLEYIRQNETQNELGDLAQAKGKIDQKADVITSRNDSKGARDEAKLQQKMFEDKVAFSTIQLTIHQPTDVRKTISVDVDAVYQKERPSFWLRLRSALASGWYGLLDVLVGAMHVWPLWLTLGLIGFAVRRFSKKGLLRARRDKKPSPQTTENE